MSWVASSGLQLFEGSANRCTEEVFLEARELRANFVHNLVSLLPNLLILCFDLRLFGLVEVLSNFLCLGKFGHIDPERDVKVGQKLALWQLIFTV